MKNLNRFYLFILLNLPLIGFAQNGVVKGSVTDSVSKKLLAFATISVFNAKDTSLITYRLSDPDGQFRIPGVPLNTRLRLLVNYLGYKVYRKEFELSNINPQLDLGTLKLNFTSEQLAEVIVTSERPPVLYKKDTIEFNASSFSTLPTAIVEDLLKKLPGVQVNTNGSIHVNGRRVDKILVDGKLFFGGDARMATRNLPANIIDKVQITDDQDQVLSNPDAPISSIGQVINLTIKRAVKKGWFGKATFGGGTDDRYEGSGIMNLFRDTLQVSILGFTNNINKAAFGYDDLQSLGGFRRSGGTGSIPLYSLSFGGSSYGIQHTGGYGMNINNEFKNGLTLNSQYFFGQTANSVSEQTNTRQYLGDTIQQSISNRSYIQHANSHKIGFGLKWRPDKSQRFEFKPVFMVIGQNTDETLRNTMQNNKAGQLNLSTNHGLQDAKDLSYSHSFSYFKSFEKQGRTLNLSNSIFIAAIDNNQFNNTKDSFYASSPSLQLLDQLRDRDQKNVTGTLSASFNEPIDKQLALRVNFNVNYESGQDKLFTYDRDPASGKIELLNNSLSNSLKRNSWRNNLSSGFNWRNKSWTITATAGILSLTTHNTFAKTINPINQQFYYLIPSFSAGWKSYNLSYNKSITPPSVSDLQPIPDNSNPVFVIAGNPDLKPSVSHNISFNFFKYYSKQQLSANIYITGYFRNSDIVRSRIINPFNGIQTTTPVNVNGLHDITVFSSLNKQLKFNKQFQISVSGSLSYIDGRKAILINYVNSKAHTVELFPTFQTRLNWNNTIELMISGSKSYITYKYDNNLFPRQNVTTDRLYNEFVVRWPKQFIIETNLTFRYNSDASQGQQKSYSLLNGAITYLFLKENKGQLKLSLFDILNTNVTLSNYISENYFADYKANTLKKYILLSFYYDIRGTSASNVGGRQRLLLF